MTRMATGRAAREAVQESFGEGGRDRFRDKRPKEPRPLKTAYAGTAHTGGQRTRRVAGWVTRGLSSVLALSLALVLASGSHVAAAAETPADTAGAPEPAAPSALAALVPEALSLSLAKGLDEKLIQSGSIASAGGGGLSLYWAADTHRWFSLFRVDDSRIELHASRLHGEHRGRRDRLEVLALSSVWRWTLDARGHLWGEAGVGLAKLSDERFEVVRMAGTDVFALQAGLHWTLDAAGNWALAMRYRHYSNGYTRSPNPGVDYADLALTWRF